jgi:translation initiation factor IF-2
MASNDDAPEIPKRRVLSLKVNVGHNVIKPASGNKTVEVEIVKKKSGLAVDLNARRESDRGDSPHAQQVSTGRLTDSEFKTRVKALQEAIRDEELMADELQSASERSELSLSEPPPSAQYNDALPQRDTDTQRDVGSDTPLTERQAEGVPEIEREQLRPSENLTRRPRRQYATKGTQPITLSGETVVFRSSDYARKSNNYTSREDRPPHTSPSSGGRPQTTRRPGESSDPGVAAAKTAATALVQPKDSQEQKSRTPHKGKNRGFDDTEPFNKRVKLVVKSRGAERRVQANNKISRSYIDRALNHEAESRDRSMASLRRARRKLRGTGQQQETAKVVRDVNIPDTITVGELANRMAVRSGDVIKYLMSTGTVATINQVIDGDTAEVVCSEFGHVPKRVSDSDVENYIVDVSAPLDGEALIVRAPVVAVMGHVDHGKTTLLDSLRQTSVAQKEAGGITQHVAAYQLKSKSGKEITVIDTPGHAAFANIRARGVVITDIIVLVVAADDGIKEQTIEVISQAKAQSVPLIVAFNKIDKPDTNIDKIKSELMAHEVVLEDFGGDALSVNISAKHGTNLEGLIEAILLQADMLELRADPERKAVGVVLESRVDKGRGVVASVIIQTGTISTGDVFVAGSSFGKIRMMYDDKGKRLKSAGPSAPIEIVGIDSAPEPGSILAVVDSEQKARGIAEYRSAKVSTRNTQKVVRAIDQMLLIKQGEVQVLNVFVKADVSSSLEVVVSALEAIQHKEIKVKVVDSRVGIVSESDVDFAKNTGAVVVAFGVGVSAAAKSFAKTNDIVVLHDNVIYHVVSAVKTVMESMLAPIVEENYVGRAEVRKIFFISRLGTIAGCYVTDGVMKRSDSKIKVLRDGECLFEGKVRSMRHEKDEIKESRQSHECGILADGFNDFCEGDIIECYETVLKSQSLD